MSSYTLPSRLPILSRGRQSPGSGKVCAEQAVNWLVSGRLDLEDESDHPSCVQPVLNTAAISVNDALSDERRCEMWPLILAQPGTVRPHLEPLLSVHLALWCADHSGPWWVLPGAGTGTYINVIRSWGATNHAISSPANTAMIATVAACGDFGAFFSCLRDLPGLAVTSLDYHGGGDDDLLAFLAGLQAEHRRLTGHVPDPPSVERVERLAELVGYIEGG